MNWDSIPNWIIAISSLGGAIGSVLNRFKLNETHKVATATADTLNSVQQKIDAQTSV